MSDQGMVTYYVTSRPMPGGSHVLHANGCRHLAAAEIDELGPFEDSVAAVRLVRALYDPVIPCPLCCHGVHARAESTLSRIEC